MRKLASLIWISAILVSSSVHASENTKQVYVDGTNDFGLQIFKKLVAKEGESKKNVLYSPLSMNLAISMVGHFASSETQAELLSAIGVDLSFEEYTQEVASFGKELSAAQSDEYEVTTANSFWIDNRFKVDAESKALASLAEAYQAEVSNRLLFTEASSADVINAWVESATKEKIKDLITAKELKPLHWASVNAIYLNAKWYNKFGNGWEAEFTRPDESTALTTYMEAAGVGLRQYTSEELSSTVWEIPYGSKEYREAEEKKGSFIIIHPKDPKDLQKVTEALSGELVGSLRASLASENELDRGGLVNLMVPAFDYDYETDMTEIKETLATGGASRLFSAFDMTALHPDFTAEGGNAIRVIKQKATITVANEGTEAAAASFVGGGLASMGPRTEFVDSAFVYLILDEASGSVLFAGTYTDPEQAETPEMK